MQGWPVEKPSNGITANLQSTMEIMIAMSRFDADLVGDEEIIPGHLWSFSPIRSVFSRV